MIYNIPDDIKMQIDALIDRMEAYKVEIMEEESKDFTEKENVSELIDTVNQINKSLSDMYIYIESVVVDLNAYRKEL